jgi:hypothetical protein
MDMNSLRLKPQAVYGGVPPLFLLIFPAFARTGFPFGSFVFL